MVEFRRDREGRPVLMEVNARMPGSMALAISAGCQLSRIAVLVGSGQTAWRKWRATAWDEGCDGCPATFGT